MKKYHDIQFPNEDADYRRRRNELLEAEIKLRNQIEEVAHRRRMLPMGGVLKENYIFEEMIQTASGKSSVNEITFSDLFRDNSDSLFIYNFMYAPGDTHPCTYCTSVLDGLNGIGAHI